MCFWMLNKLYCVQIFYRKRIFNKNCKTVKSTEIRPEFSLWCNWKLKCAQTWNWPKKLRRDYWTRWFFFDVISRKGVTSNYLNSLISKRPTQAHLKSISEMVSSFQLEVKINVSKFVQSFAPVFFLCELLFIILWKHILEINDSYKTDF